MAGSVVGPDLQQDPPVPGVRQQLPQQRSADAGALRGRPDPDRVHLGLVAEQGDSGVTVHHPVGVAVHHVVVAGRELVGEHLAGPRRITREQDLFQLDQGGNVRRE